MLLKRVGSNPTSGTITNSSSLLGYLRRECKPAENTEAIEEDKE